jgi:uncharacterized protein (DUF305 family)
MKRAIATLGALLTLSAVGGLHAQAPKSVLPKGVTNPYAARTYIKADVEFMQGMIPHHAQAVLIAGWAKSHGASPMVQALCERIVFQQSDEIAMMRDWLAHRNEFVPDSNAKAMKMKMNGMDHEMIMPGMLSDTELAELDKARGAAWDKLFLADMIKHHQGAIGMVEELFNTYGAAQDDTIFKFATDVQADQETEIVRMQGLLDAMLGKKGH